MDLILQKVAIGLFVLGGLIALFNGWIFVSQLLGRHVPSVAPFLGGLMLFFGGLIYPDPSVRIMGDVHKFRSYYAALH